MEAIVDEIEDASATRVTTIGANCVAEKEDEVESDDGENEGEGDRIVGDV